MKSLIKVSIVISSLLLISCSAGMISPKAGVTNQFFREKSGELVNLNNYNYDRLKEGYGLCIFSFKYTGDKGNKITGFKSEVQEGLRVWEYKFKDTEWDIKYLEKDMLVWGHPSALTLFLLKNGYKIKYRVTFHKGQIVYGGRIVVDWDKYFTDGPQTEFHYDEDLSAWWEENKRLIPTDKIDTALIAVSY